MVANFEINVYIIARENSCNNAGRALTDVIIYILYNKIK